MMTSPVFGKRWQDNQTFKAHREFEASLGYMKSYLEDEKKITCYVIEAGLELQFS